MNQAETEALGILIGINRPIGMLGAVMQINNEYGDIKAKNKEKIDECYKKYFEALKYPRKKKKKLKNEALKDYNFWTALDKWHDGFNFAL